MADTPRTDPGIQLQVSLNPATSICVSSDKYLLIQLQVSLNPATSIYVSSDKYLSIEQRVSTYRVTSIFQSSNEYLRIERQVSFNRATSIFQSSNEYPGIERQVSLIRAARMHESSAYYVTICAKERACLFGDVVDGAMRLNDAGQMVERWWHELNRIFATVETDDKPRLIRNSTADDDLV